jgi:hypothetical protein
MLCAIESRGTICLSYWGSSLAEIPKRNPDGLTLPPECPENYPDPAMAEYFVHVDGCDDWTQLATLEPGVSQIRTENELGNRVQQGAA